MKRWTNAWIAVAVIVIMAVGPAAQAQSVDELLNKLKNYKLGQSRVDLLKLEKLTHEASADAKQAQALALKLAKLLESRGATDDIKHYLCRYLSLVAGPEQIPALVKLLPHPELSHKAMYALERIPQPEVNAAFREALPQLSGKPQIAVINALGERRDVKAVGALIAQLKSNDADAASAAAVALGKIGGAEAAQALGAARANAKDPLRRAVTQGLLASADGLTQTGDKSQAQAIYKQLYVPSEPRYVRVASLRGLLLTLPDAEAAPMLSSVIAGDDARMAKTAVSFLADQPGVGATQAIIKQLPGGQPAVQQAMLEALERRGDKAAGPAVAQLAQSAKDEDVRKAAVSALGVVGDKSNAPLLAQLAATSGDLRDIARRSLVRLPGDGVDEAIRAALGQADEGQRVELVRSLGERRASGSLAQIMRIAESDSGAKVRAESYAVLAELAGSEHLNALLAQLVKEQDAKACAAAQKAVIAAAEKTENETERLKPIIGAHASAAGAARAAVIGVLGKLGGTEAYNAVRGDVNSKDAEVRDAAIRALIAWPDEGALNDLLKLAQTDKDPKYRTLALRGYIETAGRPNKRPAAETAAMYDKALNAATGAEEKKMALSGLAQVADPAALEIARACAADPALKAEAEMAVRRIKIAIIKPNLSASDKKKDAPMAMDGDIKTRWKSSKSMEPGLWLTIDLREQQTVRRVLMDSAGSRSDYARGYEVYVSNNAKKFGEPVATGKGENAQVDVRFAPVEGRYVKIVQTGKSGNNWSIYEITIE